MKMNWYFLIFSLIFIIFLIFIIYYLVRNRNRNEKFTALFDRSASSTEFLEAVDLGDHSTTVLIQKGDNGKTVLLLHNSPMTLNIWQPLLQTMQRLSMTGVKTPTLVAYDLRGFGTAWMPVDPSFTDGDLYNVAWSLDQYSQDCRKVYEKIIENGKVIICGFGFGGIIAQDFSLKYPDLVEKLVLLQTSIEQTPALTSEIQDLVNWISQHKNVTYLTNDEAFVKKTLCQWFYLSASKNCPPDPLVDKFDDNNDDSSPQYNMADKMMRQGSSTSMLQSGKLLATTNMIEKWKMAKTIPFGIHILAATDDPLAPPYMMTRTYTNIYNTHRETMVVLDIVNGRHGFTIMRTDYIAGIVCDDCQKMTTEDTYTSIGKNYGY